MTVSRRQVDGGVVQFGLCVVCQRNPRILTRHAMGNFEAFWSCADVESCHQALVALTAPACMVPVAALDMLFAEQVS